jgi:chemotaxis protein methyltransferase CheR
LQKNVLPELARKNIINIWHAGCSSGQEVYSMIILLTEMGLSGKANLYATDLNTDVLESARKGVYKYRFNAGYLDNFDKVFVHDDPSIDKGAIYRKYFDIHTTKRSYTHDNPRVQQYASIFEVR